MIRPAREGIEVYLCVEPVDFRKQIAGLATLVQSQLEMNPFSMQRNRPFHGVVDQDSSVGDRGVSLVLRESR